MRLLLRFAAVVDGLNRRLARLVAWLALVMVLIGAYNAVARSADSQLAAHGIELRLSSNAYLELQWYLFSMLFLLAAPYALRAGAHVRVDILYGAHGRRGRAWTDLLGNVVLLIPFCLFAVWISWEFVADSLAKREMSNDPGGLPRWILKPIVPVGFFLLALQGVSEAIKRVAVLAGLSDDEVGLDEPQAS
ncbi:MAG: C4-dicarboxylate ABC transporter substrate-binding protein [Planctomycetes bacterium]|jgi:TRAP-type mannitol/chloroaromatic compound transport system permease small subunit|nr:C4-dicarboxylate ABC transporter substrate-binding protein [Planctomycetota bacterium]MDP6423672.1 TRAP transporter small permease subunit [Planctomycetota bacterium]